MNQRLTLCLLTSLAYACGNDTSQNGAPWFVDEPGDVRTVREHVLARLDTHSRWEHEYVSDHGSTRTELTFEADGLDIFVDDFESFREEQPDIHADGRGTWAVDDRGVVSMVWDDGNYGFVDERTWAAVSAELADLLRQSDPHSRGVWPSTGYLAQDATLTRYHHRYWRRSDQRGTEDGGGEAQLTLSAPPAQLVEGAECTLRIEIEVAVRDDSGSEDFEWRCTVDAIDGFFLIRATDLPDEPAVTDWVVMLEGAGLDEKYDYGVYAALRDAAYPAVWFDPAQPEVLVTGGYGEAFSAFKPEDHDRSRF